VVAEKLNEIAAVKEKPFNAQLILIRTCELSFAQTVIAVFEHVHLVPRCFEVIEFFEGAKLYRSS
jgi:hypothetical protein